jgi:23S rRNA (adenine2503-C2)-methyltransferase
MRVVASAGREDVATVYIVEMEGGALVECVESLQPPLSREQKWVLLVSTLYGCPIGCEMCDAGGDYKGKLDKEAIHAQIDFLVRRRYPDHRVPCRQWKIQFARMGEPSLNEAVLDVLGELPELYHAPGLLPSLSTIAPSGTTGFFERLMATKREKYGGGRFQFQFSVHSTDAKWRDRLMPVEKWSLAEMAAYGERFYAPGDRRIVLNFALARGVPVDPAVLCAHFDPDKFLVKITPLNPTYRARRQNLQTRIDPNAEGQDCDIVSSLEAAGYQVIVSIGEAEENLIGSNCGQYLKRHLSQRLYREAPLADGYVYYLKRR